MKYFLWIIFLFGIILLIYPKFALQWEEIERLDKSYGSKKEMGQLATTEEKLSYWICQVSAFGLPLALAGFVGLVLYYLLGPA